MMMMVVMRVCARARFGKISIPYRMGILFYWRFVTKEANRGINRKLKE